MHNQSLIYYRIAWKPSGYQPGANRGLNPGIGDQLRALVLLRDHPDPRRLDLRASLRDPFERLWVRDFYLNTALKLIVLLDASASMAYVGKFKRLKVAEDIITQLAISAYRSGDAFGMYVAKKDIIQSATIPPKLNQSAWLSVRQQLQQLKPTGASAEGLLRVVAQLPQKRSLVFVVSDFRWPDGQYAQLLKTYHHHDVVPVVLQDPAEMIDIPRRGIASVQDMETGETRFVWMRPALKAKLGLARDAHIKQIEAVSRRFGVKPCLIKGAFDAKLLNQYFLERSA